VQQGENPKLTVGDYQVEIGHSATEQRVPLAEVVMNAQTGPLRDKSSARLVQTQELGNGVAQGLGAVVWAAKRDLRHSVLQYAGSDRVALGVIGIEKAFW
jgi:hypothetical protein